MVVNENDSKKNGLKYQFARLQVINRLPEDVLRKADQKLNSGKNLSDSDRISFNHLKWATFMDKEKLEYAGEMGWEIKSVCHTDERWDWQEGKRIHVMSKGEVDIYYLQRDSSHPNFGKEFLSEYHATELCKEHSNLMIHGNREGRKNKLN